MNRKHILAEKNWLTFALMTQRNVMTGILRRLTSLGLCAGSSERVHRKFLGLMDQIAHEQRKELTIINDIEDMEKLHARLRESNRLRRARQNSDAKPVAAAQNLACQTPDPTPPKDRFFMWLALFMLFSAKPIKHENQ